jgi:hypothetical protein
VGKRERLLGKKIPLTNWAISIKARVLHAICFSLIISNLDNILKWGNFGLPSLIEWIYRNGLWDNLDFEWYQLR